jgi:hypothetical protein
MPFARTPAYGTSGPSGFSATQSVAVDFGSNANRGLLGDIFFENNFNPTVPTLVSVVIDPGGAAVSCTIGARRAGSVLNVSGYFYAFWAVGASVPTGVKTVTATASDGNGKPRMRCFPIDDATAISAESVNTGFSLAPTVTVSSAASQVVFGLLAAYILDSQTVAPTAPATQVTRVVEAAATGLAGAMWQEAGAASVTLDGTYTGSMTQWAMTAWSVTGHVASLTGAITADDALPTGVFGAPSSGVAGSIVLDPTMPAGQLAGVPGSTVRTLPFSRNSGARPVNLPENAIAVLSDSPALTRIAGAAGLTLGLDGRLSFSDPALPAPGTDVIVVTREADGRLGVERYQVVSG